MVWCGKTSKSGSNIEIFFSHYDFEICFAPQPRALFRHLNFQKCSNNGALCTFDFKMRFAPQRRALFRQLNVQKWSVRTCRVFTILTTACTFSTSQRPKVLQQWCLLHILISKCASGRQRRANFISHLPRWLRTRGFCEPTAYFSTLRSHKTLEKYSVSTFSRPCIFFFLPLSSLTLPTSAFPSVLIVGNLTSKLPSTITCQYLKQSSVYP